MGVCTELQSVWKQNQIEAAGRKWQGRIVTQQRRLLNSHFRANLQLVGGQPLMGHTIAFQSIHFGHTQLQRVVAENIDHRRVDARALPVQQVASCGSL